MKTIEEKDELQEVPGMKVIQRVTCDKKNIFSIKYSKLPELLLWNQIRQKIFDFIESNFIKPILESGMKKTTHKTLIQNNYRGFTDFFYRKLRYFLVELVNDKSLSAVLESYTSVLKDEIDMNVKTKKDHQKTQVEIDNFLEIINSQIDHSLITRLPEFIGTHILKTKEYQEMLGNYFNEYIHFLIVF